MYSKLWLFCVMFCAKKTSANLSYYILAELVVFKAGISGLG